MALGSSPVKLTVKYDPKDLERASIKLSDIKHDMPIDTAWATNRTLTYAKSLLAKAASKRYRIAQRDVKKSMSTVKANAMRPMSALIVRGKPRGLIEFRVTHPKKSAPKAAQLKGGSVKPLIKGDIKAFFAMMASGHSGVFQRQGRDRLPIKELYGSSVPKMIAGNKGVYTKAEQVIADKLAKNFEERVKYRIRKANYGGTWEKMAK
jgi:hypothetical protein